jgi:uncharacterized protein
MTTTFVPLEALRGVPPRPAAAAGEPPWMHLVPGPAPLVFVVAGSRLYAVSPELYARLGEGDPAALADFRRAVGAGAGGGPTDLPRRLPAPAALSLQLAQACNLSCSYCYADEGRFGGPARLMPREVALAAIDQLLGSAAGRRVTVGFIGGEPFLNRAVLHDCVRHARGRGRELGVSVAFSVTTNGTLLTDADRDLLRDNAFAVSVSLDGPVPVNDRHRRSAGGSAGARALQAVRPLLGEPGRARVVARVTVARDDLRVAERVEALAAAGFREVGVSPLRASADPDLQFRADDWPAFLREMVRAARHEWQRVHAGGPWRFGNLAIALKELHRGSCRPLPCGAANGYVSVSAEGRYFACHRTIDDPRFSLGDLAGGPDQDDRRRFLHARHADRQEPCRSCWARYLCGGGCHAEVLAAGRTGCDYVRGWLDHCLALYDVVLAERPDLLGPPEDLA